MLQWSLFLIIMYGHIPQQKVDCQPPMKQSKIFHAFTDTIHTISKFLSLEVVSNGSIKENMSTEDFSCTQIGCIKDFS